MIFLEKSHRLNFNVLEACNALEGCNDLVVCTCAVLSNDCDFKCGKTESDWFDLDILDTGNLCLNVFLHLCEVNVRGLRHDF